MYYVPVTVLGTIVTLVKNCIHPCLCGTYVLEEDIDKYRLSEDSHISEKNKVYKEAYGLTGREWTFR